jgi:hypothetical protein
MAKILAQDAERMLGKVPDGNEFRCCDESELKDVQELGGALISMSDETFYYHSNEEKKDFGNWVRDVIGDQKLANDLDKSPTRNQAAKNVTKRLAFLSEKLS